jgi:Protein of unknown function (DUF4238)
MGKESTPRRHHYIPQFYLRGFGDDKGHVRVVDLRAQKHFACSSENIAHVRDFYAFENPDGEIDFSVETEFFNGVDGEAAQIIDKINKGREVTMERDWEGLCHFIASLEVRTPSQRQVSYERQQYISDLFNEPLATSLEACETRLREHEAKTGEKPVITAKELQEYAASHQVEIPQAEHIGLMMSVIPQSEAIIRQMTPHLFSAGGSERFISSDSPIVKIDTNEELAREGLMGVGWATPEVQAVIPLTKTRCLVLDWGSEPGVSTVDDRTVASLNALQLLASFQYAFADTDNFCFIADDSGAVVRGPGEAFDRFGESKLGHRANITGGGIVRRAPKIAPL